MLLQIKKSVASAGEEEGELELPSLHLVGARATTCGSDSVSGGGRGSELASVGK